MEGLSTRRFIGEEILAARCQAAGYLAHNFSDLPNNIAPVAAERGGGLLLGFGTQDHFKICGEAVSKGLRLLYRLLQHGDPAMQDR
jgi:hypothetical protein